MEEALDKTRRQTQSKKGLVLSPGAFLRFYNRSNGPDLRRGGMPAEGLRETPAGLFAGKDGETRLSCVALWGKPRLLWKERLCLRQRVPYSIGLPEGADVFFFLCKELIPGYLNGVSGEYAPPDEYFVAEREPEAFELFETQFPPKRKLKLSGQIF